MANEHKKTTTKRKSAVADNKVAERKNWLLEKVDRARKRAKKDKKYEKRLTWAWAFALTLWVGVTFFVAQMIVFGIASWLINQFQWGVNYTIAETVCMVLSYVVALAVMIIAPKKLLNMRVTRDGLGLHGMPTWTDILLSPIGYILSIIASIAIMMVVKVIAPGIDWEQKQDVGFNSVLNGSDRMVAFVALVILAPITEELIFRGFLYGKLRNHLSAMPAIILVSVLFGVLHGQWNVGIIVGLMSVFMCLAREITGTIYAGILLHMIRNGLAFYFLYIAGGTGSFGMAAIPLLLPFLV